MKKLLFSVVLVLLCFAVLAVSVSAEPVDGTRPRVIDDAGLMSQSESAQLERYLREIGERRQFDIVIVTVESLKGEPINTFADDVYDYYNYGYGSGRDGLLLLLDMEARDWYISTTGFGIRAVTDAGRLYLMNQIIADLQNGAYYSAFTTFADSVEEFVVSARTGNVYDVNNLPELPKSFPFGRNLLISLVIGLLIAWIVTGSMRAKLKTVRTQQSATDYTRRNSMRVVEARDFFLYAQVSRTPRQQSNNGPSGGSRTHTSSSGVRHGGGGGKF